MSSPAKRRKKNDFSASDKPVRSLDYFFAKQKDKSQTAAPPAPKRTSSASDAQLTDEELARKLQEEWNREDGADNDREQGEQGEQGIASQRNNCGSSDHRASDEPNTTDNAKAVKSEAQDEAPAQIIPADTNTLKLQSTTTAEDTVTANIPFDESPLTFEPSKYVPSLRSHWLADGGYATYALLTRCFVLVNSTQSRIKIVDTLVNLLRTIIEGDPDSLLPAVGMPSRVQATYAYVSYRFGLLRTLSHRLTLISNLVWVDQQFQKR